MSVISHTSPAASTHVAASGFFADSKRGEVNELKELLKNLNTERCFGPPFLVHPSKTSCAAPAQL